MADKQGTITVSENRRLVVDGELTVTGSAEVVLLKFGEVSGEDVVIATGNFVDGADSGYAPGSIGMDTTDGALFVSDSAGLWQQLALVP
jgi:hypothetical protein